MNYKLRLIALCAYLVLVVGGFALTSRERALFGMGMLPGPRVLFAVFGLPLVAAAGIGVVVYRRSGARKVANTVLFAAGAISVWLLALLLFH